MFRFWHVSTFALCSHSFSAFQKNVRRMSELWRNQPDTAALISPVERAVQWIEYVMEYRDLEHLQSPVANVPFRVVYSVDLLLAAAFTVIGFWAIFFKHMIWDKMRAGRQNPVPTTTTVNVADGGGVTTKEGLAAITEQEEDEEGETDGERPAGNATDVDVTNNANDADAGQEDTNSSHSTKSSCSNSSKKKNS